MRSPFTRLTMAVAIAAGLASCRALEVPEPFPCSKAGNCPAPYRCGSDNMCRLSPVDGGDGPGGHGGGAGGGASGRGGSAPGGTGGSVGGGQAGSGGGQGGSVGGGPGGSAGGGGASGSTGGNSAGTGGQGGSAGTVGTGGGGRGGSSGTGGTAGTAGTGAAGTGGTGAVAGTGGSGGMPGGRGGNAGGTGGSGGAPVADGQPCNTGTQCQSTYCVDSVCCESMCPGTCAACAMAKTGQQNGRCRPIPDGQNPDNECSGAMTCSGSTLTPAPACNGANACRPGTPGNCPGGFACAATGSVCRTSCAVNTDCAAGYYCNQSVCVVKKGVGVGCGGAGECSSGACVDSVCCSSACALAAAAGSCMGCSNAATGMQDGTCAPRQGAVTRACPTTNPTACVNLQTDPDNCGICGRVCSASGAPTGTTRACLFGGCDFKCTAPLTVLYTSPSSVRSCRKSVWDFENPDTSLLGIDGWNNSNETLIRRLNMPNSGNWSVGLYSSDLEMYPAYTDYYFRESNNDLGYVDVRGKTVSAYVYVAAMTPDPLHYCRLQASTANAPYEYFFGASATKMQPPANMWFELKGTFGTTSLETQIVGLWVMCKLPTSWANDETKLWFVDDVSIY